MVTVKHSLALLTALLIVGCGSQDRSETPRVALAEPASVAPKPQSIAEPDIKGMKLGDEAESFKKKFSNAMFFNDKKTGLVNGCLVNDVSYGNTKGMMLVVFQDGKAVSISVQGIDPSSFPTVENALIERMGPPDESLGKLLHLPSGSPSWGSNKWIFIASPNLHEGKPGVVLLNKVYLTNGLRNQVKSAEADL